VLEGTVTVDGNPPVTVYATDNNVAYPGGPPAGAIALSDTNATVDTLALANVTPVTGLTVLSSTEIATKAVGNNDLNSSALQIVNNTGQTVTVSLSIGENNFLGPANTAFISGSGTWTNAIGSAITDTWYDDPTNTQPLAGPGFAIPGTLLGTASHTVTLPSDSFNYSNSVPITDTGNYSMTLHFTFTLVNGGTFVSRGQDELKIEAAVPEPSTMAIAGLGALGFIGYALRRKARSA
jgi:hypothetical protein